MNIKINNFPVFLNSEFKNKKYAVSKLKENSEEEIRKGIRVLLDTLEWKEKISKYSKIMLKPNFTDIEHKQGVTTSPIVLRILVEEISKWNQSITIVEGNGGSYLFSATEAAQNHGIFDLVEEFGVNWVNVSELPTQKVSKKINGKKLSIRLPKDIEKYGDVLISVPVFKNHCMTRVTLGIKNLWGLIPSEMRMLLHSRIDYYLPLIMEYYNHQFTFIDGTIGLEGNGPIFGDPVEMKTFLAANDPVVADIIGSWIMKVNPKKVSNIKNSARYFNYEIDDVIKTIPSSGTNFQTELNVERIISNYLDLLTFKNSFISRVVFNSPLTPLIYFLFNIVNGDRTSIPPKKLKLRLEKRIKVIQEN